MEPHVPLALLLLLAAVLVHEALHVGSTEGYVFLRGDALPETLSPPGKPEAADDTPVLTYAIIPDDEEEEEEEDASSPSPTPTPSPPSPSPSPPSPPALTRAALAALQEHVRASQTARQRGQLEAARGHGEACLRDFPLEVTCMNALANVHLDAGRFALAEPLLRRALEVKETYRVARSNLVLLYMNAGKLETARDEAATLVAMHPDYWYAHFMAATVEAKDHRSLQAVEHFARAYETAGKDKDQSLLINYATTAMELRNSQLAYSLTKEAMENPKASALALANHAINAQHACMWEDWDKIFAGVHRLLRTQIDAHAKPAVTPFHSIAMPIAPDLMRELAVEYARHSRLEVGDPPPVLDWAGSQGQAEIARRKAAMAGGTRRLRVGYLSTDFRDHPTGQLMTSLFALHSRDAAEIFVYMYGHDDQSDIFARLSETAEHWIHCQGLSQDALAKRIFDDGIDVLVDTQGWLFGLPIRTLALRAAPVQITFLAFPGTSGASWIDYLVTDKHVSPPHTRGYYSEPGLIFMPHHYQINGFKARFPQFARDVDMDREHVVAQLSEENGDLKKLALAPGPKQTVFCNFNSIYKLSPDIFASFMRILKRVPNSHLVLVRQDPQPTINLRAEAKRAGVDPARIVAAPYSRMPEHLYRARVCDLFLDTPSINAHSTAAAVLFSGTPILTMSASDKMAARLARSMLVQVGLDDLIVDSLPAYEDLAVKLVTPAAEDAGRPAADFDVCCSESCAGSARPLPLHKYQCILRKSLATSPLFDDALWTRNWEKGLHLAWQNGRNVRDVVIPED